MAKISTIEENDANRAIIEVVQEVERIETNPSANYPDRVMQLLLEIRDQLNELSVGSNFGLPS